MFHKYFKYSSGKLFWLDGREAFLDINYGYARLLFKGRRYKIHRVIWFLHHGTWPSEIDHINGDRLDNRIENLRAVSRRDNQGNKACHRAGKLVGTNLRPSGLWGAKIRIAGKDIWLGTYHTEVEAHQAYLQARSEAGV